MAEFVLGLDVSTKTSYIYLLLDPTDHSVRYVGKTTNPKRRLTRHLSDSNLHDTYKNRWINKLKLENKKPILEIIDEVPDSEWQFWEQYWIEQFKIWGFKLTNGTKGGDQPPSTKGRKHTEESKRKMSETKKGKPIPWLNDGIERSEIHRVNLSKSLKGRKSEKNGKTYEELYGVQKSYKLKEKLSKSHLGVQSGENHPMYGKKHTDETKRKISENFNKKVIQLDDSNNIIKIWDSIKFAQIGVGITNGISNCCQGKQKTAGGYKWEYLN